MAPEPGAPLAAKPSDILRPLQQGDREAIARGYAKATVLAGEFVPLRDALDPGNRRQAFVLTEGGDSDPVGLAAVALDDPGPNWATVRLLAIATAERRDLAARAIALLEANVRRQAEYIRAAVPLDAGLALYFWLRLGYHPAISEERLWMARDLSAEREQPCRTSLSTSKSTRTRLSAN